MSRYLSAMDELIRSLEEREREMLSPYLRVARMHQELFARSSMMDITNEYLRHELQQRAITDVLVKLDGRVSEFERIARQQSGNSAFLTTLLEQQDYYARALAPYCDITHELPLGGSALVDCAATWQASVEASMKHFDALGLVGRRDVFLDRLMAPARTFTTFVEGAAERLNSIDDPAHVLTANAVVRLVEDQYASIAGAWAVMPTPADEEAPSEERTLDGPLAQLDDALATADTEAASNVEALMRQVPTVGCVEMARATLDGVFRANEAAMSTTQVEIFKPTTRFAESCSDLPWVLATDKKGFGEFVDCLYFIFYEAPGKDKLRFLKDQGGFLEPNECDFIWCLKHLRNKYSRHDPDHGKPSDIKKSWEDLQLKWESLGLATAPVLREHFLHAQEKLLRMAHDFMGTLLAKAAGETVQ